MSNRRRSPQSLSTPGHRAAWPNVLQRAHMNLLDTIALHLPRGYSIQGKLGEGATSSVYLARGDEGSEPLAVKVMLLGTVSEESLDRFMREMQVLEKLDHPRIPRLLEPGEANGSLFFTMRYINGQTLRARIRSAGRLSVRESLLIARDIGGALDHAHSRGVVHRDVKPDNIFVTKDGAFLMDFGLAAWSDGERNDSKGKATVISGTPDYMSPEQASGHRVEGWRSDFYSLGCVLYEMLSGRRPFAATTSVREVIKQRRSRPAPDVCAVQRDVPEDVSAIVRRSLNPDPSGRFA